MRARRLDDSELDNVAGGKELDKNKAYFGYKCPKCGKIAWNLTMLFPPMTPFCHDSMIPVGRGNPYWDPMFPAD